MIILDNIFRINKLKVGKRGYGTKTKRKVVFVGFRISIFIIGVIAYMDRSNISYIAPQMMEDLHMTKQQLLFILLIRLRVNASTFWYVS